MIDKYFDKIYCINLDYRLDRLEKAKLEFSRLGLHNVTLFKAIEIKNTTQINSITQPEMGVLLSHLEIIKDAKNLNLKSILIFEDDVEFDKEANRKFDTFSLQVPENWDMLYFGANHLEEPLLLKSNLLKLNASAAIHAYAVKSTMYDVLINGLKFANFPVDIYYSHIHKIYNCFCFYPHLAWQRSDYSNIQHTNVSYDFIKNYRLPLKPHHLFKRPGDAIRRPAEKFKRLFKRFF